MRGRIGIGCAVLAGLLLGAGNVAAAVDGKLSGSFTATVHAVEASFPVDDTPTERDYAFKCKNKSCSKVAFTREGGDGVHKSTLKEKKPGVFKGEEVEVDSDCPDSDGKSTRTIAHTVQIVKVDSKGRASRLKGRSNYTWPDCPGDPTQTTAFKAKRN